MISFSYALSLYHITFNLSIGFMKKDGLPDWIARHQKYLGGHYEVTFKSCFLPERCITCGLNDVGLSILLAAYPP